MASHMLQVPSGAVSLPPSQTPTIVVNMSSDAPNNESEDVHSIQMDPTSASEMDDPASITVPLVSLTFLLLSGKRRTLNFEQDSSFAEVKERLVHEWPADWEDETKPQTASQIRLLHLGRLLQDDETLSAKSRFQPRPAPPTIVHLSVRPFAVRAASGTGSFKNKASLLRTASFSFAGRGNAPASGAVNPRAADGTQLEPVREQQQDSGCCCIIC